MSDVVVGTPAYMAPEQGLSADGHILPATDVFGVGATAIVLLAGRAVRQNDVLLEAISHPFPTTLALGLEGPRELLEVFDRAVRFAPQERYAGAAEMLEELERLANRCNVSTRIRVQDEPGLSTGDASQLAGDQDDVTQPMSALTSSQLEENAEPAALGRAHLDSLPTLVQPLPAAILVGHALVTIPSPGSPLARETYRVGATLVALRLAHRGLSFLETLVASLRLGIEHRMGQRR